MRTLPKYLVHVSRREFPEIYWESFEGLNNLYVDSLPVIVGYRGNLYRVSITEHSTLWFRDPSYQISTRYKINIWDFVNNRIVGEGNFSLEYQGGPSPYTMSKIRAEIKRALIKATVKPTDFYK